VGLFLAGMLLADSSIGTARGGHRRSRSLWPTIAIGMSVDLRLVIQQPLIILGLTAGLMTIKALVLCGRPADAAQPRLRRESRALHLPGRQFASSCSGSRQAPSSRQTLSDMLIVVASLSMAVTPLVLPNERVFRIGHAAAEPRSSPIEPETIA
jgi:Kef-type K+ transport system membrane component KefB